METSDTHDTMPTESIFPNLRFEGGDVVFHLSKEKQDILILPSTLLLTQSEWFKASLRWQEPKLVSNTTNPTWHYRLLYDPSVSTWTLQSMKDPLDMANEKWFSLPAPKDISLVYTSDIPSRTFHPSPSNMTSVVKARERAVQSYKLLFAILLKQRVDLEALDISDLACRIANMIPIAEFYQLLGPLKVMIEALLCRNIDLDTDIIEHPAFYLEIGSLLRSRFIFEEAMRHFVGRADEMRRPARRQEYQTLSPKIKLLALKKELELRRLLADMNHKLLKLNALELPSPIFASRRPTMREETRFLARAIWQDWLAAKYPCTCKTVHERWWRLPAVDRDRANPALEVVDLLLGVRAAENSVYVRAVQQASGAPKHCGKRQSQQRRP